MHCSSRRLRGVKSNLCRCGGFLQPTAVERAESDEATRRQTRRGLGRARLWLGAAGTGALWAAAFSPFDLASAAWLAPGLLFLLSGAARNAREAFFLGGAAGLAQSLLSLHWLLYNPFPAGAAAGWLALSVYLALYPAAWCAACRLGIRRLARACPEGDSAPLANWGSVPWLTRQAAYFTAAAMWVALEMARSRLLTGFPWNLLGVSQHRFLPLVQTASVAGVYGLSFLAVWVSVALAGGGRLWAAELRPRRGGGAAPAPRLLRLSAQTGEWILPLLAAAVLWAWGWRRIQNAPPIRSRIKAALIQPAIPQRLIFDPSQTETRRRRLIELTDAALAAGPDLAIWPEASLPNLPPEEYRRILERLSRAGAWFVFGAEDAEPDPKAPAGYRYYNAAFCVSPAGRVEGVYHKRHLVIFGEYIPFERLFPWMKRLSPLEASYTPGAAPAVFRIALASGTVRAGPLICFEDAVPSLARASARAGADFLLNLTNDAWFGESAAQWQHAWNAMFRAVENGLPLVRCANNGLTCWFDPAGRLRGLEDRSRERVYGPGAHLIELELPADAPPTFYRRHGDMFGWGCVGWSAAAGAGLFLRRRRRTEPPSEDDSP